MNAVAGVGVEFTWKRCKRDWRSAQDVRHQIVSESYWDECVEEHRGKIRDGQRIRSYAQDYLVPDIDIERMSCERHQNHSDQSASNNYVPEPQSSHALRACGYAVEPESRFWILVLGPSYGYGANWIWTNPTRNALLPGWRATRSGLFAALAPGDFPSKRSWG